MQRKVQILKANIISQAGSFVQSQTNNIDKQMLNN